MITRMLSLKHYLNKKKWNERQICYEISFFVVKCELNSSYTVGIYFELNTHILYEIETIKITDNKSRFVSKNSHRFLYSCLSKNSIELQ